MTFARKIFIYIALLLFTFGLLIHAFSYQIFSKSNIRTFNQFYWALNQTITDTLVQLDQETNSNIRNVQNLINNIGPRFESLSKKELQELSETWNISGVFVIDGSTGKYLKTSEEDPAQLPSLYDHCDYRYLLSGNRGFSMTPLIQGEPMEQGCKFFLFPSLDRTKLYEIAVQSKFLGKTLQKTLLSFESIASIGLFAPNGASLGFFSKDRDIGRIKSITVRQKALPYSEDLGDRIYYYTKVPSSVTDCCECKKYLQETGATEYFYILRTEVSKKDLYALLENVRTYSLILTFVAIAFGLLIAGQLSKLLTKPIFHLSNKMRTITESGTLDESVEIHGQDEIAQMGNNFNLMIQKLREAQNKLVEMGRSSAIINTIKSVAHDIRKPFSMLEGLLRSIRTMNEPTSIKKMADLYLPDVENAIVRVNHMLDEMMDIGRELNLKMDVIGPEELIQSSLKEASLLFSNKLFKFSYGFDHKKQLFVDKHKCQRVFSNIITNAMHAANAGSDIFFRTKETPGGFLTVTIGNSGSCINPDDLPHIFEPFYTKSNSEGTGLGLSIAKKVILAHGGKIWCESSVEHKIVEFHFTLPIAKFSKSTANSSLPTSTQEFLMLGDPSTLKQQDPAPARIIDPQERELELKVKHRISQLNRPFVIGLVEDEPLYREAFGQLIFQSSEMGSLIKLIPVNDSDSAIRIAQTGNLDALICDVDLGKQSLNGFELVEHLKQLGFNIPICIHSNRCLPEDYERSVKVGAQSLLPKPMLRVHLLKFILNILDSTPSP